MVPLKVRARVVLLLITPKWCYSSEYLNGTVAPFQEWYMVSHIFSQMWLCVVSDTGMNDSSTYVYCFFCHVNCMRVRCTEDGQ